MVSSHRKQLGLVHLLRYCASEMSTVDWLPESFNTR